MLSASIGHWSNTTHTTPCVTDLIYLAMHTIGVRCQCTLGGKSFLATPAGELKRLIFLRPFKLAWLPVKRVHTCLSPSNAQMAPALNSIHCCGVQSSLRTTLLPASWFCQPHRILNECAFQCPFCVSDDFHAQWSALDHAQATTQAGLSAEAGG